MSRLNLNIDRAMAKAERKSIAVITAVTEVGKDVFQKATPKDTTHGVNSVHRKVYDSKGQFVNGDETDGNDNTTPDYQGIPGFVTGIVATNENIPSERRKKVPGFYLWAVNRGVRGRTGVLMREQARAAMDAERKRHS